MHQQLLVATSDAVNRNYSRFTPGALMEALWERGVSGLPMFLSHDGLRPLGWSYPFALHYEPGLCRLVGMWLRPETAAEAEAVDAALRSYLYRDVFEEHGQDVQTLCDLLALHLGGRARAARAECAAVIEPDLAMRIAPDLFALRDKDGLVPLAALEPLGPGVFRIGALALFAHPYFRRSLYRLNTLNSAFLGRIQHLYQQLRERVTVKIALDPDMVGLAATYRPREELEYWWGPKFSDDLATIPTGVTRHEAADRERWFHGISGTEFWWQSRDGQHILEAEELRDIPSAPLAVVDDAPPTVYGCRYVHAIVQEGTGTIEHFDGALRAYPEEQMVARLGSTIAEFGRHSTYTKLWRVDGTKQGAIGVAEWKGLLADYFRDNRLVGEYLGASVADEQGVDDSQVTIHDPNVSEIHRRLVPYTMAAGTGVRVVFSCHRPQDSYPAGRSVIPLTNAEVAGTRVPVVEADTLELRKMLTRQQQPLTIPDETAFVYYKDLYVNLPLIFHAGTGAGLAESLSGTLLALSELVAAWRGRAYDLAVAYHLGFLLEGREVRISVLGHVQDVQEWLDHPLSMPPLTQAGLRSWAEQVSSVLGTYAKANDTPTLQDTLLPSGLLYFQREGVDPTWYEFEYAEDREALMYQLTLPTSEAVLGEAIRNAELRPALAFRAITTGCGRCGEPYEACGCSKIVDDGVVQEIVEADHPFLFWSDRFY